MIESLSMALVGAGQMGEALLRGLLEAEALAPERVRITSGSGDRARRLGGELGVQAESSNAAAVRGADVVVLAVKPQQVAPVLEELREVFHSDQLLISVAASVGIPFIEKGLPIPLPVVRAMPNSAARIKHAITGIASGSRAGARHLEIAREIFAAVGRVVVVDEKHLDAITGLSASGLAFIYVVIESLADGGVMMGLDRATAMILATQTVLGSAKLILETGTHPGQLKDMVSSPGGTTIAGIAALEEGGVRRTFISAVERATQRSRELGKRP